jgi:hypothetical protein
VTFALLHSFLSKEIELDVTRRTQAERLAMPLARDVVKDLAVEHGACIRPVQLRRTSLDTGTVDQVLVPAGTPSPPSARLAPREPRPSGPPNAGRAGT